MNDGIHGMVARNAMSPGAARLRDFYARRPDAPIYQCDFGFYSLERWKAEGHIDDKTDLARLFSYDEPGSHSLGGIGWCEAAFCPQFSEQVLEDRGEYEVVRDTAGRHLLCFKGRRSGFMPEYVDHPVKDRKSWEENCLWRMDPSTPERYKDLDARMRKAREAAGMGRVIVLNLVGGYMYLRSLMGPLETLYMFHDDPDLIHACMKAWLSLADKVASRYQEHVTIDEVYFGEDICYNHGCLISPEAVREFLFPYYRQLLDGVRARQIDKGRHLFFQVDTDGNAVPVIPLYRELGMDYMSPFEVASGCDVVEVGKRYPDLLMRGGFDKRILAKGREAIDREVDRILPVMRKRGGYIPNCDHGVPAEVGFEDYMHFRGRILEFGK